MPRKKGKKRSGPEDAPSIPGLTSARNVPSSSREQPPAAAGGSRQGPREQVSGPAQLPRPRQPEPSGPGKFRQDAPASEVRRMPGDPGSSREQRPSTTEPSDSELIKPFRQLAIVPKMPKKPKQPGRLGRPVSLISNLYPLKFNGCYVYHYDVVISRLGASFTEPGSGTSPDSSQYKDSRKKYRCLNTRLNRKVFRRFCIENFEDSFAVYDGEKNMYCMEPLPIKKEDVFEVRIEAENAGDRNDPRGPRMDIFEVQIQPVEKKETGDNIINLEPLNALFRGQTTSVPLEAVMVLETVLRYVPCLRFVPVGRNFFSPPDYKHPLGSGKEIWFGHHQSVRLAQTTAVVNLDVSASSFYESISVIEYIEKLTGKNLRQGASLDGKDIEKINKDIKNICVETTHQPAYRRKYHIEGLSNQSANRTIFKITENNQEVKTTVENYYRTRYNVRLMYPHLPCLKVRRKDSCLPMEVCEIVKGQHSSKELNPKQQAEMIKYTAKPPQQRFGEIENVYKVSNFHNDPYLQRFGLQVLDKPLGVKGRTMEAPNVIYRQNSHEFRERPRNGSWNMRDKQFFTGTTIDRWTLLSFATKEECHFGKLKQFAAALERFANEQGVEMSACSHIEIAEAKLQNVQPSIKKMQEFHSQLIFVVLPTERQRGPARSEKLSQILYSEVKRVAETALGIVTQCVKGENVVSKGTNPSLVSNLCLKMNAKMGGVNNSMVPAEVSIQPHDQILFVGADVNHPAPTENTYYSLAAVVGNVDNHPSRYTVIVKPQKNDENYKSMVEVIMNMKEMMKSLLMAYYTNTRMKPKKIIVYRDGVSDGQFADVQAREIEWIREACTSVEAGYKPGITFIVVQKRHHVRFLEERRGNPSPGTVVDTVVTHPLNYDFFLYSHSGIKGTSRPSYYTVLADDNNYSFDALEKMTYSLCYTYVRCTKSISLPAPVQYADLAAYRARRHMTSKLTELEAKGKIVRGKNNKFDLSLEQVQGIINVKDCMKDTMYYA